MEPEDVRTTTLPKRQRTSIWPKDDTCKTVAIAVVAGTLLLITTAVCMTVFEVKDVEFRRAYAEQVKHAETVLGIK